MKTLILETFISTIQKLLAVTAIGLGVLVLCSQTAWASPITPGSFSIIVKTDNPGNTGPTEMSVYAFGVGYDYDAYWEEVGNDSNNGTSSSTGSLYLDFLNPGIYRIDITGDFPAFFLSGEAPKLLSVEQWGNIQWRTMERALYGAVNARINATDAPDLSQVTDMGSMFCQATSMNDSINHWDVSTVTDMGAMFAGATAFNQPLDNWDVSNVTNMGSEYCSESMFEGATAFNQSLANWVLNPSAELNDIFANSGISTENYSATLIGWANLPTVPSGRTLGNVPVKYSETAQDARRSLVTDYSWSITDGGLLITNPEDYSFVTVWDTRLDPSTPNELQIYVTGGSGYDFSIDWGDGTTAVYGSDPGGFISHTYSTPGIKTVTITGNFSYYEARCSSGAEYNKLIDVAGWGRTQWEYLNFYGCSNLERFSAPDVPNVSPMTDMSYMFEGASSFNGDINDWDVSNVTNMEGMFYEATSFNQPLNNWNVSNVANMSYMFYGATAFNQRLDTWDVSNVTTMEDMLTGTALSEAKYTRLLNSWSALSVQPDVYFGVSSQYCGATAQAARDILTNAPNNWIITDGGATVDCVIEVDEAESSGGSSGTRIGDRVRSYFYSSTTSSTPAMVTTESFLEGVRNLVEYLSKNEDTFKNLTPEESTKIIIGLRDIILFLLTLLPGV